MAKLLYRILIGVLILGTMFTLYDFVTTNAKNEAIAAKESKAMYAIHEKLPVPENTVAVNSSEWIKQGYFVSVTIDYQTSLSWEQIQAFYLDKLPQAGWKKKASAEKNVIQFTKDGREIHIDDGDGTYRLEIYRRYKR